MRIAIVDDLETERAQLKTRLARQLRLCGAEAELLEFESGESFLAAEKEQRFTAAFLDIYMHGMSGMDAAKELRKTDADCLLVFTTTSTDHALEGFQVRALHYLVKPFSEEELSALLAEMLARLPRPEPVLTVKVSGSDVRLCYRDISRPHCSGPGRAPCAGRQRRLPRLTGRWRSDHDRPHRHKRQRRGSCADGMTKSRRPLKNAILCFYNSLLDGKAPPLSWRGSGGAFSISVCISIQRPRARRCPGCRGA